MTATALTDDGELVARSLKGDREAFGRIVSRYQGVICALTYSATGSLTESEDLAQETFVAAWRQLATLREPQRLRAWLCGIARNVLAGSSRRRARQGPRAELHEETVEATATGTLPVQQAISHEEATILWRALEALPATYREPLILFYRQQQSVERVAETLELSQDAVKQRLARGRKMLHAQIAAFVEGALERTAPGQAFTLGVLAGLPMLAAGSVTGTALSGTAVKVGTGFKLAAGAGLAGALLGPIIGVLAGAYGIRRSIRNTRTPRERQFMIRQAWIVGLFVLVFLAALEFLVLVARPWQGKPTLTFVLAMVAFVLAYAAAMAALIVTTNRRQRQIQIEDGTAQLKGSAPIPSRKRQLWNAYGSMAGSTSGVLAWMIVQTIHAQEWGTTAIIVVFGTLVTLVSGRALLRQPHRRLAIIMWTLLTLVAFTAVVVGWHWHDWQKSGFGGR